MATSVSVRKHGRLTVRIDRDGHALVVRVLGDLDIASAPALENSLRHVLKSGAPSIVLDLTGVTFIDPTGLRVLQWATPALTGAIVVLGAQQGEQQKAGQVLTGAARRTLKDVVSAIR